SRKLVYRLHRPMIGRRHVAAVALWNAGGDCARVLVRGEDVECGGDGGFRGLDARRGIALEGWRTLQAQGGKAADEAHPLQYPLGMPGVVHVSHEEGRLLCLREARERVRNTLE